MTPEEALALFKQKFNHFPATTVIKGPDPFSWDEGEFYYIYKNTNQTTDNLASNDFLIDAYTVQIYDLSRGELAPLN